MIRGMAAASALAVGLVALTPGAAPEAAPRCEAVASLLLRDVKIASAVVVPAGPFTPPGSQTPLTVPAFCRVAAVATPTSDSIINFEVWIPPADAWNGKLQGVGNPGYSGAVAYAPLAAALRRGYAAVSTDTGHTGGDDPKFAAGHPERIVDWGYRAVHVVTEAAKPIVRAYHGRLPAYSYFTGCSTGGHQGLSEAQRFPDDYDGIVVGDPGNNRTRVTTTYLWAWKTAHDAEGAAILPVAKLPLINHAAIAACDADDGVRDGVIDDPRKCRFDPAALVCRGPESDSCLTTAQVDVVRKIYEGPKNPRTGEPIHAGWTRGSEVTAGGPSPGWANYITGPREPNRLDFWRHFVFNDPNFDWRTFDFDRDVAYADAKTRAVNAVDPNLAAFKASGGKMVMYTGWGESAFPALDTVGYYEAVEKAMGGPATTKDFARLFMLPGVGHCGGGPGPGTFDALAALEQWVERGVAPDRIVASRRENDKMVRTRPLCPYPMVARWKGTGSTDEAANFTCAIEPRGPGRGGERR